MGDDESRRRDILARIGASIRDAQYALTVNSPKRVQNAVSETQMAIIALSEYLALPNGVPKAAAVAKRIAKVLGSVISLLRHSDSGAGSTTQCEIEPADKPPSHESSFPNLFDEDSDVHELSQLREKLASTQEERDSFVALLRDAQQEVASLKESVADPTQGLSLHTAEIERVNSENKALKELLQEEILKSKALAETVRESNEQLQKISHENATTQTLLEQHRMELKEKEQEIAAKVRAASKAAIMNPKPIDNEEIEALHLQVKLMRQALRECINNSSAAEIKAGKKTLVDIENEHQEQLLAMKNTLETQCKRENNYIQQIDDLKNFIEEIEKELERERQRAEDAERCAHDTAGTVEQRHREQLATLEAALEQQRAQHASEVDDLCVALERERRRAEDAERCAHDTAGTVEQRHREQLATLEAALEQQRAQHASEVDDLRVALERERRRAEDAERCAHDTAGTVEQRHREQLATLEAALEQQRAQHASEVDDLCVALERERRRAEDAERCAHDTAGTVEQRHREQLATLEAALEQQRAQHASEVDDLRVALERERRRAEDAERCAHDTAGTVEQCHREQLATLEAALEQQHASEVDDLRVALERERRRAEDAERCAHDTAGTVEQRHREQLATLEAALEQQRAQHASEVDDLRVALERERRRAEDAERCAHDTAGTVEQRHREQLATLEAALEQQRAQHASEVDDLCVALERERRRAEDAERCAHDTAGTVEQRHREQLATLEAALEQQRAQHASEVDDLRVALERERRRAEDAERCAHDTAGTVEQCHREQLATLEAALEQQHASEVDDLRVALERERRRAEDAERCAHDTAGTVEQRHREQLATLEAALEQQRAQHASEVDDLRVALERERQRAEERVVVVEKQLEDAVIFYRGEVEKVKSLYAADRCRMSDKLSSVSQFLDESTKEADGLRNKVKIFEEENRQLRLKCEGTREALTESEVALREERRSLMGEVSLLRSRCLALEQEVAAAVELSSERAESVNRLMQQLAEAKSMVANSLNSDSAKIAGTSVSLEEWVHFLRGVAVADLKRAARGVVVVNEETQDIVNLARDLRRVIDHTAGLSVQVLGRQRQLTQILNVVAAKQCVALRKIQQCLLGSVSLQETDVAILEACLLLFNDVESALSEVAEPELKDTDNSASLTPVKDERDALLQRTLRRARNRVNENTSSPLSSHGVQPVSGSMITPVKTRGTPSGMRPSSERKFLSSPERGHTSVPRTKASPHNSRGPPEHLSKMDVVQCSEDPFDYAVATLSAQEKQYDRRQHSMPPRRWLTPGKKGTATRAGL